MDLAGAEPVAGGALALAHGPLQDQAILPDVEHSTRLLVDDAVHPVNDSQRPTAVWEFLPVERQTAVEALLVKSCRDLLTLADAHEVTRLNVEIDRFLLRPGPTERQRLELAEAVA